MRRTSRWLVVSIVAALGAPAAAASAAPVGVLTQLGGLDGCVAYLGASGCAPAGGVRRGNAAIVSPDGRHVYAAAYRGVAPVTEGGIAVFRREEGTGKLTQLPGAAGCVTRTGTGEGGPGSCTGGRAIDSPDGQGFAFSRDGRFLYAAMQDPAPGAGTNG